MLNFFHRDWGAGRGSAGQEQLPYFLSRSKRRLCHCLQLEDAAFDPHERPRCPVSALTKSKEAVQESKRAQRTSPRDEQSQPSCASSRLSSHSAVATPASASVPAAPLCSALLWPLPVHLFGLCSRRTDVREAGMWRGAAGTWVQRASTLHAGRHGDTLPVGATVAVWGERGGQEPSSSAASGHVLLQCQLLGPRLTSFGSKRACSVCQSESERGEGAQGHQRCRVNVSFT